MGGKTRTIMRADLRLDLKDSGALWSDAELDRCIERAFADLSRYLPDEKIYEESLQFAITDETVTTPATTSLTAVVNAQAINVAAGSALTIAGQPDIPRPLTITITDADNSTTGATFIIKGMDENEKAITETLHYSRGDSKTIVGVKYFKYVYEVELDQIAGAAASDTASVGYGLYSGVWISLANKPVKWSTETLTSSPTGTTYTRDTDYEIDYANGRIRAKAGKLAAATAYLIDYTKSQIAIDLSSLADFIRVARIEYPVGEVPQSFVPSDIFGKLLYITGGGETDSQSYMAEDEHIRVYYDAEHIPPTDFSPSTAPEFLENTLLMVAAAYALYIYALKNEHQALTDMTSARTDLGSANTAHTALSTALTNIKKYLDNNTSADAAGILQDITDDAAALRTAIATAVDALNAYIDAVATDLTNANSARANYMGATANYVDGTTAPGVKKYLDDGDATLNTVAVGGEGQDVPRAYREYAQTTREALVAPHEQDRQFYLQDATARTNAAMQYANEAAQRLSNLRSYIEQSAGYVAISSTFAREAEDRIAQINAYMQEANQYAQAAATALATADRFKAEADERRNEAYSIWRDRKQYIGDFTAGAVRQMPTYR